MAFSLDQFYRLNRRALIWVILLVLLYMMRDFFGLIFLTFVLAFFSAPLARLAQRYLHLPRRASIFIIYGLFLVAIVSFVSYVTPQVIREANTLIGSLDLTQSRVSVLKDRLVKNYPSLNPALMGYIGSALSDETLQAIDNQVRQDPMLAAEADGPDPLARLGDILNQRRERLITDLRRDPRSANLLAEEDGDTTASVLNRLDELLAASENQLINELRRDRSLQALAQPVAANVSTEDLNDQQRERRDELMVRAFTNRQAETLRKYAPGLAQTLKKGALTIMLALLFSFLIMLDISRLGRELASLRQSRLHDFYEEAAQPVVRFAYVVGRGLQAQAVIACCNTVLTLVGLLLLGMPSLAMLALIVFVCSFIPVLGVFISTGPIILVALNSGGLSVALGSLVMVIVIHAIEAYLLNPMIYGHHMKLNPVLVLIILFVGHHAFGIWGMLLGVPVAYYVIHDVFGVKLWQGALGPAPAEGAALGRLGRTQEPDLDRSKTDEEAAVKPDA